MILRVIYIYTEICHIIVAVYIYTARYSNKAITTTQFVNDEVERGEFTLVCLTAGCSNQPSLWYYS